MKNTKTIIAAALLITSFSFGVTHAESGVNANVKSELKFNLFHRDNDKKDDRDTREKNATLTIGASPEAQANAKSRAYAEIDARIASLNKFIARVNAMTHLSAAGKANITASVNAQIGALNTLRAKIAADTDVATLKADIASITKTYRIYMLMIPQASIAILADKTVTTADLMANFGTKLQSRINDAKNAGKDVSVLTAAMTTFNAKLADAKVQAQAALTLSANLAPDNGNKTIMEANKKALLDARAKLRVAHDDLKSARKAAGEIVKTLKSWNIAVDGTIKTR